MNIENGSNLNNVSKLGENNSLLNREIIINHNDVDEIGINLSGEQEEPGEVVSLNNSYTNHVDTQDIIDTMFVSKDLSDYKQGQISVRVDDTAKNANTFNSVERHLVNDDNLDNYSYYDPNTEKIVSYKLENKLNEEYKQSFFNSDKGKEILDEIGVEIKTDDDGKNTYSYKGRDVNVELSKQGTLRVSHLEHLSYPTCGYPGPKTIWVNETNNRFVDFKLRDDYIPKDVKDTDIQTENKSNESEKNDGPNPNLLRKCWEGFGEILKRIKQQKKDRIHQHLKNNNVQQ